MIDLSKPYRVMGDSITNPRRLHFVGIVPLPNGEMRIVGFFQNLHGTWIAASWRPDGRFAHRTGSKDLDHTLDLVPAEEDTPHSTFLEEENARLRDDLASVRDRIADHRNLIQALENALDTYRQLADEESNRENPS